MGSYAALAKNNESATFLRVVDAAVTVCLTQEEAHELFERVLNSTAEDTPASAQALKKLAAAIGNSFGG
ncbi:MAG: hypothetical protein ACYC96_12490 [Fimbriimonadaceae bacterium]